MVKTQKIVYNNIGGDAAVSNEYKINFTWDDEVSVWIATSDDVPGLILEHDSFDVLVERVRLAVPELLAFEHELKGDIFLDIATSRYERVTVGG